VVALILGVVFRNEDVSVWTVPGVGLVLLGAYVTGRRERPRAAIGLEGP
jgi:drug/metabolite transporter (DMT)-like permease